MDLCVIDWRAVTPIIASIIASGVALYISNKWNGQKGIEVIANEAKYSLQYLAELQRLQCEISASIQKSEKKELNQIRIDRFKIVKDLFSNSTVILDHSIDDPELQAHISTISSEAINFIKQVEEYYFNKDTTAVKALINVGLASVVTLKLLRYALYYPKFKLKHTK